MFYGLAMWLFDMESVLIRMSIYMKKFMLLLLGLKDWKNIIFFDNSCFDNILLVGNLKAYF